MHAKLIWGLITQILAAGSLAGAAELVTFSGATMGTRYAVTIPPRNDVAELQRQVDARLQEINGLMSTYDETSELSRFNQYTGEDWFAVSDDTARVVKFALGVALSTEGAFDPTVGPVVNLWGFGPDGRRKEPPNEADIAAARERIGYQNLAVRREPPALRKLRPDLYLDLSAVAKGFAVDELAELLADNDCPESLVVIGGEVRASGKKPDGSHWRIGIEEPNAAGQVPKRQVQLEDAAIGTSGDWRNAFNHDGVRYSHVINPETGRPVNHSVASVTVIADKAIQTDAWSTALLVMGEDRGIRWCEAHGVAAMFFVRRPDGSIVGRGTTHLAKRVVP